MRTLASVLIALVVAGAASCSKRSSEPVPVSTPEPAPPPAPAHPALQAVKGTVAKVRALTGYVMEVPVSAIRDDAPLAALPNTVDDLAVVELVLSLEEAFNIEIPDQDLADAAGPGGENDLARHLSVRKLAAIIDRKRRP
jgi:acyl carrier protein